MTNAQLIPALVTPLLIWRFYRRFRSNIGRQNYRPTKMIVIIVLMTLIIALLAIPALRLEFGLSGLFGGLAIGVATGFIGIKLTRFEVTPEGKFYTPNPYLGVAVSLLLVGRLIYRFMVLSPFSGGGQPFGPGAGQSPLTLLMLGITFGYYIMYSSGVLFNLRSARPVG